MYPSLMPSSPPKPPHLPLPLLPNMPSNPLDGHRPLRVQRVRVPVMALLLAVLQPAALVVLEHAVLAAKVALAEGAVPHDPLRPVLAVLEVALDLLGRHAAPDRQGHVQGRRGREQVGDWGRACGRARRGVGGGQVLAGVDEADVGGWGGGS